MEGEPGGGEGGAGGAGEGVVVVWNKRHDSELNITTTRQTTFSSSKNSAKLLIIFLSNKQRPLHPETSALLKRTANDWFISGFGICFGDAPNLDLWTVVVVSWPFSAPRSISVEQGALNEIRLTLAIC